MSEPCFRIRFKSTKDSDVKEKRKVQNCQGGDKNGTKDEVTG